MGAYLRAFGVLLFGGLIAGIILFFWSGQERENLQNPLPLQTKVQGSDGQPSSEAHEETTEVHSPDGKMKIAMLETLNGEIASYVFSVSDISGGGNIEIFSKILPNAKMDLPKNSFSPDNKFFFIKEIGPTATNYFVFKATGEAFSEGEQFIDVMPLFVAKNTGFELSDVTGWASPTLLYLLTKSNTGESGPTYWLEIPSLAIIRLADR